MRIFDKLDILKASKICNVQFHSFKNNDAQINKDIHHACNNGR